MTARIEKDIAFQSALHIEGNFCVNLYELTLFIEVNTESVYEQNIAMDRMLYMFHSVLQNSIFIDDSQYAEIDKYRNAGLKVCELIDYPCDQVTAMTILLKLNAILDTKMYVDKITISSLVGDGIRYTIDSDISESLMSGDYWWNNKTPTINNDTDFSSKTVNDNVLELFDTSQWCTLGLSWNNCA